jgi:heme-degrading monooxygenase HmoA
MHARVTLLEVDTLRSSIPDALTRFRSETLPRLRGQPGYLGVWVLATPEGKGLLMSLWETEAQGDAEGDHGYYAQELGRFATLFRSAPGREEYEVLYVDEPSQQPG